MTQKLSREACLRALLVLILFTVVAYTVCAQNQYATWVFGDHIKLSWYHDGQVNREPILTFDAAFWSVEGSAMISDHCNGELRIQSDGNYAWTGSNSPINGSLGLCAGPSSAQNCIFIKKPRSQSEYILFAAENLSEGKVNYPRAPECDTLGYTYSTFRDTGTVLTVLNKNRQLFPDAPNSIEAIAATRKSDGTSYWIATGTSRTGEIRMFTLDTAGVASIPVVNSVGRTLQTIAIWKFSPDGKWFVTSDLTFGILYKFNNETGELSEPIWLNNSAIDSRFYEVVLDGFGPYTSHGIEFSSDSKQLYVLARAVDLRSQRQDITYRVLQFSIDGCEPTVDGVDIVYETSDTSRIKGGGVLTNHMLLGLDGRIWINVFTGLDVISRPNVKGTGCNYVEHYFKYPNYPQMTNHAGLPTIVSADLDLEHDPTSCRPPWPNLLPDTICVGECAELSAAVTYPATSFVWSTPGGRITGRDSVETIRVCYDQPGEYPVILTTGNNYGSDQVQTTVVVLPTPMLMLAADSLVCSGEDVVVNATGASTYEWTFSGVLVDSGASFIRFMPNTDTGVVLVHARTDVGSCTVQDSIRYVVSRPEVTVTGNSQICKGDSTVILAATSGSVVWIDEQGTVVGSGDTLKISPLTSLIVRAVTTSPLGCRDTAEHAITVIDPVAITTDGDTTICPGESATLTVKGGAVYRWEPAGAVNDPSAATVRAIVDTTTMFYVTAFDTNGCASIDSVLVRVNAAGSVELSADTSICEGQPLTLSATSTDTNVEWIDAATQTVIGVGTQITLLPTSTQRVVARLPNIECSRSDTLDITVTPRRVVVAGPDTIICVGSTITLVSNVGKGAVWFTQQGDIVGRGDSIVVTPGVSTKYLVTADCADTAIVTVRVQENGQAVIAIGEYTTTVGSPFTVPIVISNWLSQSYTTTLHFDGRLLEPTELLGGRIVSTTGIGSETASAVVELSQGTGHELKGSTWLAPTTQSMIVADDIINDCGGVKITPGLVSVTGCGLPQRTIRTVDGALFNVSHNAESDHIHIDLHALLASACDVMLYNTLGECLHHVQAHVNAGINALTIDATNLPAGLYLLSVHNSMLDYRAPVLIR